MHLLGRAPEKVKIHLRGNLKYLINEAGCVVYCRIFFNVVGQRCAPKNITTSLLNAEFFVCFNFLLDWNVTPAASTKCNKENNNSINFFCPEKEEDLERLLSSSL
jgi:hypothetical protein